MTKDRIFNKVPSPSWTVEGKYSSPSEILYDLIQGGSKKTSKKGLQKGVKCDPANLLVKKSTHQRGITREAHQKKISGVEIYPSRTHRHSELGRESLEAATPQERWVPCAEHTRPPGTQEELPNSKQGNARGE